MTGQTIGVWCNGNTVDSDSTALGSIPGTPAINSYMNITKFPVLITSPARCGSTALLRKIAVDYNLVEFSEPSESKNPRLLWYFNQLYYREKRKDLAIKIMSISFDHYNFKLDDFFTIRLKRKNIIEQCASYYLARARKKWHYTVNDCVDQDTILIDNDEIKISIDHMIYGNNKNNSLNYNFDLDVYYEDLDLSNPDLVKNPKPKNYQELLDIIKADIDQR